MKVKKNQYKYLKASPRISGVNSIYNIGLFEKWIGKRDIRQNQLCQMGEGHITPYINNKDRLFNSYINKVYLRTSLNMDATVQEANALTVELNILLTRANDGIEEGNEEEVQRQRALQMINKIEGEKRKAEILIRIAEIKAESDMIDESLKHHIERAEGIFHSHLGKYWRGILSASSDNLEHFPCLEKREYIGRAAYIENRGKLISMIEEAIVNGGGLYDSTEE